MPAYDLDCDACGFREDVVVPVAALLRADDGSHRASCDRCGAPSRILLAPVRAVGVLSVEEDAQIGTRFHSNREKRAWCEKMGVAALGADSEEYRRIRERALDTARTPRRAPRFNVRTTLEEVKTYDVVEAR